jgi:hypothetical protein
MASKLLRLTKWGFYAFILLSSGGLQADSHRRSDDDYCCYEACKECDAKYEVGVDFLCWVSTLDFLDAAKWRIYPDVGEVVDPIQVPIEQTKLNGDFAPGVRIYASADTCLWDLSVDGSYSYVKSSNNHSLTNDHLTDSSSAGIISLLLPEALQFSFTSIDIVIDDIKTTYSQVYQGFDLLIGKEWSFCGSHQIKTSVGLGGLLFHSKLQQSVHYFSVEDTDLPSLINFKGDFEYLGFGLKSSFEYNYAFCDSWSIDSILSASIYYGKQKNHQDVMQEITVDDSFQPVQFFNINNSTFCSIPELRLGLGVSYNFENCWCDATFKIGYEMIQWWGLLSPFNSALALTSSSITNAGNAYATSNSYTSTKPFGFQGLTLGAAVRF